MLATGAPSALPAVNGILPFQGKILKLVRYTHRGWRRHMGGGQPLRYQKPAGGGRPSGRSYSYALLSLRESNCTIGHSKNNLVAFYLLSLCISEN